MTLPGWGVDPRPDPRLLAACRCSNRASRSSAPCQGQPKLCQTHWKGHDAWRVGTQLSCVSTHGVMNTQALVCAMNAQEEPGGANNGFCKAVEQSLANNAPGSCGAHPVNIAGALLGHGVGLRMHWRRRRRCVLARSLEHRQQPAAAASRARWRGRWHLLLLLHGRMALHATALQQSCKRPAAGIHRLAGHLSERRLLRYDRCCRWGRPEARVQQRQQARPWHPASTGLRTRRRGLLHSAHSRPIRSEPGRHPGRRGGRPRGARGGAAFELVEGPRAGRDRRQGRGVGHRFSQSGEVERLKRL